MDLTQHEIGNLGLIQKYEGYNWFNVVKLIKNGDTFGELALKNNDRRAATIRCETKSYFAVMHKKDYDKFFKRKHHKNI